MGMLVDGVWSTVSDNTKSQSGDFKRKESVFRNWITVSGDPGPSGEGGFQAAANRYHLYVSLACPWAHRTLIFRKLKSLENLISVSIVAPDMLENGWEFSKQLGGTGDEVNNFAFAHEIYTASDASYTGKVTVPILWDKQKNCIVSNESAEIIRMFNSEFNHLTDNQQDFYPKAYQTKIDEINDFIYPNINNGVYRCGFATSQKAYEQAFNELFAALDKVNEILTINKFLIGDHITEADWRLFTTLVRFDAVYVGHFKCNKRQIESYPALREYLRKLYQWPGVAETVNMEHIKRHYYFSHKQINPTQIIPKGPEIDYTLN